MGFTGWGHKIIMIIVSWFLYQPPTFSYIHPTPTAKDRFWRIPQPDAGKALLFFHGNAADAACFPVLREIAAQMNMSYYSAEYPGYGNREPLPRSEQEMFHFAEQAMQWVLEDGFRPEDVIVWGNSLGSAPAVHLASKMGVGGLVVHAGFASIFTIVHPIIGDAMRRLGLDMFDNRSKLSSVSCATVFAHAPDDRLIQMESNMVPNSRALPNGVRRYHIALEGGHNACMEGDSVSTALKWILDNSWQ